jgi:hypothetical protein
LLAFIPGVGHFLETAGLDLPQAAVIAGIIIVICAAVTPVAVTGIQIVDQINLGKGAMIKRENIWLLMCKKQPTTWFIQQMEKLFYLRTMAIQNKNQYPELINLLDTGFNLSLFQPWSRIRLTKRLEINIS